MEILKQSLNWLGVQLYKAGGELWNYIVPGHEERQNHNKAAVSKEII